MFNLIEIVRRNRETFYNFSTGQKLPLLIANIVKILIATILAGLFSNISKDFLNATITIYSILIGFSFNILFYLLSLPNEQRSIHDNSIEKEIKIEKTNKITNELFYNVSYFNIIAICMALVALLFFLFDSRLPRFTDGLANVDVLKEYIAKIGPSCFYIRHAALFAYRVLLYYLLIESMYSFIRTTGRVSFFFRQKIALRNDRQES